MPEGEINQKYELDRTLIGGKVTEGHQMSE